jgi:hypothetical protein
VADAGIQWPARGLATGTPIDDLGDYGEWVTYLGDGSRGQNQIDVVKVVLGTRRVRVIGVGLKHSLQRLLG